MNSETICVIWYKSEVVLAAVWLSEGQEVGCLQTCPCAQCGTALCKGHCSGGSAGSPGPVFCLLEQVKCVYSKGMLDNMRLPFVGAKCFHPCGAKGRGSTWQPCSCRNLNLLIFSCLPAGILQPRGYSYGHD